MEPKSIPFFLCLMVVILVPPTSSFCPQYCVCNDTSLVVRCHSSSNLRVVPIFLNPQIKDLTLSNNQIKDVTLSLQFYQELTRLDISANVIPSLGKGNFESLKILESLNVSYNQIKTLESGVFQGLSALTAVDITGNQVERVDKDVFSNLKNLREIILDRNRMESIDWEIFRGLGKLTRISIQYNFIQVVEPSPSLKPSYSSDAIIVSLTTNLTSHQHPPTWTLKSLHTLDISSNQLTRVKDNSLQVFVNLKSLNLCCNYIHTLENSAFSSLNNSLERINLSQNRLSSIPSTSLILLSNSLRVLDLSSNRLSGTVPPSAFKSLFRLQHLRISDNSAVTAFHPDALSELINLVTFEADHLPNLTSFSGSLLSNKPFLTRFSLRYAQIVEVAPELLQDVTDISAKRLDLLGNPIQCNCSAYPLLQYLQGQVHTQSNHADNEAHKMEEEMALDFSLTFPPPNYNFHQSINHTRTTFSKPHAYVDQSQQSRTDEDKKMKKKHGPFYLSSVRCHGPPPLSGILVKDLKNSDFSDCFAQQDHFQLLVICIAVVLLSVIFLVLGVKLCCLSPPSSDGERKRRRWCDGDSSGGESCCGCSKRLWRKCFVGSASDKEQELDGCNGGGGDKLFDGFRKRERGDHDGFGATMLNNGGSHNSFPNHHNYTAPNGMQIKQSPSGKLFLSADNSSPSPPSYQQHHHHTLYPKQPQFVVENDPSYHVYSHLPKNRSPVFMNESHASETGYYAHPLTSTGKVRHHHQPKTLERYSHYNSTPLPPPPPPVPQYHPHLNRLPSYTHNNYYNTHTFSPSKPSHNGGSKHLSPSLSRGKNYVVADDGGDCEYTNPLDFNLRSNNLFSKKDNGGSCKSSRNNPVMIHYDDYGGDDDDHQDSESEEDEEEPTFITSKNNAKSESKNRKGRNESDKEARRKFGESSGGEHENRRQQQQLLLLTDNQQKMMPSVLV